MSNETAHSNDTLVLRALIALYKARQANQTFTPMSLTHALVGPGDASNVAGDRLTPAQRQAINVIHHTLVGQGLARLATEGTAFVPTAELTLTPKGERGLARAMLGAFSNLASAPDREEGRVSETTLKGPAMFLLLKLGLDRAQAEGKETPQAVEMTTLRTQLRELVPKSPEDLAPLAGRTDAKVDQVIRNMISNNSLTDHGWVKRVPGGMQITERGTREVLDHLLKAVPMPPIQHRALASDRPTQVHRRVRPR